MFADFLLHERLLKSVQMQKYTSPTDVQRESIPAILSNKDLLVSAPTGTGKTAAYLLQLLQQLITRKGPAQGTRVLILAPTRELAQQIVKECQQLARFTRIGVGLITGGTEFKAQNAMLRKDPDVVVATPGRLIEHLDRGTPDFKSVEAVVLDEADRMLDMGFQEDVMRIVKSCPEDCQKLMFSATLKNKDVNYVANLILNEPQTIAFEEESKIPDLITQQLILADNDQHKELQLLWLLENETYNKALIFTKTRLGANRVRGIVRGKKLKINALHSEITQDERNETMRMFRRGEIKLVVATDVAARGLDIADVDLVINFDFAGSGDEYVHRIGRTGRAGNEGSAISFVTAADWNLMASIERYLSIKLKRRTIKSLAGHYKGPKKLKASGKAASGNKKKKIKAASKPKSSSASKKQRGPTNKKPLIDGFAPVKKKPS
jgi:superfamily II DNA/RNA helicase